MTPQERQLVDELFTRLAAIESSPREADAVAAINDGLRRAPNAIYALVQTVLLQDEALKQAHARLQQYEAAPQQERGFLDSMRDSLFGAAAPARGSVPSVRGNVWNNQQQYPNQPGNQPTAQPAGGGFGGGGSFLGTAAAAAAGAIGGSLLMNSLRGAMGGGEKHAFGSADGGSDSKSSDSRTWGDASNSDLARDAGAGDVGKDGGTDGGKSERQGLFDTASNDQDDDDDDFDGDDFDGDAGDSDVA